MKILINIIRVIVGLLFIFSGLIKANDPLGLSYKMQEFFELWGMTQFNDHTLWLSVVMIAFEIIAGVALLLGWRMRLIIWLLLLLIVFFTFLTGYAYLSGKFKNCGCFGDCIPITPLTSFVKDLVLTVLILFLFRYKDKIKPVFSNKLNLALMLLAMVFSFGVQWYMLNYLPMFDCLGYKKGKNIKEQMKIPAGAIRDSFDIRFVYEKDGKEHEFSVAEIPSDTTYKYKSRTDKLIRKGNAEPPVKGFSLSGVSDEDSTDVVLSQSQAIIIFSEDFAKANDSWKRDFAGLYTAAKGKGIPVYAVTGRMDNAQRAVQGTPFSDMQIFTCDITAIRTAARANPTVYLLKDGTIAEKQSYRRMDKVTALIR
jgi:uncharacterized membrane protein YphA (DoxX/SURF4 family)